ncbi:MAG TPA: hypothetical protein VFV66_14915 [Nonomuraea sp.]|nr:hypothetical protein [Nonomuraea sp.]
MRKRTLVWVGSGITLAAMAGLAGYFARVGLDAADKLSSVIGVFVAVSGLALALYGTFAGRPSRPPPPTVSAGGTRSVAIGGDNTGTITTGDTGGTAAAGDGPAASPEP